jgi:predicted metal-dependent peptidase
MFADGRSLHFNRDFVLSLDKRALINRIRMEALQNVYEAIAIFNEDETASSKLPRQGNLETLESVLLETISAIVSAAQASPTDSIPFGVRLVLEEFTSPIDWRTLLEMHIQDSIKNGVSFNRPSPCSWSAGDDVLETSVTPNQLFKVLSVAIAIDTSGTITDEILRNFLSEVKCIMETFDEFELWLWTFDTRVYNPKKFTPRNLDEIYSYVPMGGGDCDLECCWTYMRQIGFCPDKLIVFTDGYPGAGWGDEEWCDTLFIIHGNGKNIAPFGITAYYEIS